MTPCDFISCVGNSSVPEAGAVLFAILYVVLASYEKVWCWPAAAASAGIYIFICYEASLLLETVLQAFYLIMAFYGWYEWLFGKRDKQQLYIVSMPVRKILFLLIGGIPLVIIAGYVFGNYFQASLPYLDATVTIYSFIATWMVARKIMENWLLWVVIDLLAIYLYANRGLCLSGVLYFLYTVIAIFGYFKWKTLMQKQTAPPPPPF